MSKITVTEIAGQTSGSDQNLVKLPSNNTLQVDNIVNRGGDNDSGVDLSSNDVVAFKTANAERVRVDSSGKFLLGTSQQRGHMTLQIEGDGSSSSAQGSIFLRRGLSTSTIGGNVGADLGLIQFGDNDGGIYAKIEAKSDASAANNDYPGRLLFSTTADGASSSTERMRIDSSGRVGIGQTSPNQKLHLTSTTSNTFIQFSDSGSGGSAAQLRIGCSGNDFIVQNNTASNTATTRMQINSGGSLNVMGVYNDTTTSSTNVNVASDGHIRRVVSSRRYKNTINDATHGLKELLTLRSVTYKGNNENFLVGGLIAEEVHDSGLTEFVEYDDDGKPDSLAYSNMVSLCIKAIQELEARLTALESK